MLYRLPDQRKVQHGREDLVRELQFPDHFIAQIFYFNFSHFVYPNRSRIADCESEIVVF